MTSSPRVRLISWDNPCLWAKLWISTPSRGGDARKKPSKTALVLGGGGFTGGVYEIGALRALDLLAVNSTVNNFDIYVGTSAGSFVAGMLANGITPDEMMQVLNKRVPSELEDLDLDKVLQAQLHGLRAEGGRAAPAGRRAAALDAQGRARSRRSTSVWRWRRPCRPASTRAPGSATTSRGCSPTPAAPTTSG